MHELSIALSLIDLAAEQCVRREVRVVAVHLRLGPLSGVAKEALLSAYQVARQGTPLADARLVMEDAPVAAWCPACQCERRIESIQRMVCPVCNSPTPDVRGGRELEIVGLEVLDGNPDPHGRSPAESPQAE